jgi:putative tricarboxylic transport membrane protein
MRLDDTAAARQRRSLIVVGVALLLLAAVTWADALRLGATTGVGVGPSVAVKLIGSLLGILGAAHLIAAFGKKPATTPVEEEAVTNHQALGWVIGGLLAMIGLLAIDGGFILGASIVFATTARAFGRPLLSISPVIGLVLSTLVYVFFTKVLTLSLPSGPLERLLFA